MPTVDEVLNDAEVVDSVCVIDSITRVINIPSEYEELGVESDEKVLRVPFTCPKIVGDNIDLSNLDLFINYRNANDELGLYLVDDVQVVDDKITFSWLLSRNVTKYQGTVDYIVCAKKSDNGDLTNEWNTKIASGTVAEGLEANRVIVEESADVIEQILASIKTSLITLDVTTKKASMTRSEILAMEAKGYRTAIKFLPNGPMAERMSTSLDTDTSVAFVCSIRPIYTYVIGSHAEMNTVYLIDNDGNYTTYDYQLGNNRNWVTKDGMFYPEQNGFKDQSEGFFFSTETFKDIPYLTHKDKLYQYIGLTRQDATIAPCITFRRISNGFNGAIIRDGMISDGTIPDILWMSIGEYDSKNKCYPVHEAFSHSDELILITTVDNYDFYTTPPKSLTFNTIYGPLHYRDVQDALTNRKRIRLLIYVGSDNPDASIRYSSKAPIELVGVCSRDFSASYYPDAYSISFFGVVNGDGINPTFASLYLHMSRIQYNPNEVGAAVYRSNNNESVSWPYYQIRSMQFSEVSKTLFVPTTAKANQIIAVDTVNSNGIVTKTKAVDMPVEPFVVTFSLDTESDHPVTCNKTFAEISNAIVAGKYVIGIGDESFRSNSDTPFTHFFLNSFSPQGAGSGSGYASFMCIGNTSLSATPSYFDTFRLVLHSNNNVSYISNSIPTMTDYSPFKSNPLSLTGVTAGQIAKISKVDSSGNPTKWEAADLPSGDQTEYIEVTAQRTPNESEQRWEYDVTSQKYGDATKHEDVMVKIRELLLAGKKVAAKLTVIDEDNTFDSSYVLPFVKFASAFNNTLQEQTSTYGAYYYFAGENLMWCIAVMGGSAQGVNSISEVAVSEDRLMAVLYNDSDPESVISIIGQIFANMPINSITSASVGQILKVSEVDSDGKPTAYEPVDMPSGGSGSSGSSFVVTVTYNNGTFASDKTFAEIEAAVKAGSLVRCHYIDDYIDLWCIANNSAKFVVADTYIKEGSEENAKYTHFMWTLNIPATGEITLDKTQLTVMDKATIEEYYVKKTDLPTVPTTDSELSTTSTNPVQNKIIKAELDKKLESIPVDGTTIKLNDQGQLTLALSNANGVNF